MLIPCFTVKAVIKLEHTETDPGQWQIFKLFGLKHLLISKKLEDDFQLFQLNEMSIKYLADQIKLVKDLWKSLRV